MSIIRTSKAKDDPYARIANSALRDQNLSWKARGLLAYLLSMPDNWETNSEHLAKQAPEGRHAVQTGLKELEIAGYLERRTVRDASTGHVRGRESIIYERPIIRATDNPAVGKPEDRKTRGSENPRLRTTDLEEGPKELEERPKDQEQTHDELTLVTVPVVDHFPAFWNQWPDKRDKAEARRAFARAAKRTDPDVIIGGAHRFANDPNLPPRQFMPLAATWLNKERWNDPPLASRTGLDRPAGMDPHLADAMRLAKGGSQ